MKRLLAAFFLISLAWTAAMAKGPQIDLIDNKLSVSAENVSVGRLLQLVDMATGLKSRVPPELANRNISVRFSGLPMAEAVRKMFQGQTFDYVVIEGQGIIVTSASQNVSGPETATTTSYPPPPAILPGDQYPQDFGTVQGVPFQNPQGQVQQQPATIQTPFGTIANPRAQQQQQQQPNSPLNYPGQQNSLFPQTQPMGQPPQTIITPGQPGMQTPFGTPSPFGAPPTANPNNGLFGSTPVFGTPGNQQPPR